MKNNNNNIRNIFDILLSRIFNKSNFNKFLIIFIVGFVSRIFMGYFGSANVYMCMSFFIILVHEFVEYFNFNVIPSFSSISYDGTKILDNKPYKESSYILEKNNKDESKKSLPRGSRSESTSARREEIRIRREAAEKIAQERLRSGQMKGGEINFDANTSSQTGSNKRREDLRLYQASLELPPMIFNNNNFGYKLPVMEPIDMDPEPPVKKSYVYDVKNASELNNYLNSNTNQSNTNNDFTNNNQGNTNNKFTNNNQGNTSNNFTNNGK